MYTQVITTNNDDSRSRSALERPLRIYYAHGSPPLPLPPISNNNTTPIPVSTTPSCIPHVCNIKKSYHTDTFSVEKKNPVEKKNQSGLFFRWKKKPFGKRSVGTKKSIPAKKCFRSETFPTKKHSRRKISHRRKTSVRSFFLFPLEKNNNPFSLPSLSHPCVRACLRDVNTLPPTRSA